MNDIETVAIAKVVKAAALTAARNELEPGRDQPVDVTIRVFGTINVGEDGNRIPTVNIPIIAAMSLMLHDAGITGPHAVAAIMRAMRRAIENDEKATTILDGMRENMDEAERKVRAALAALPAVSVKGTVTTKLEIETVVAIPA